MNTKKTSYEEAIKELNKIIQKIDSSEIPIDELSKNIEEANKLIKYCEDTLTKAESKISKLIESKK